VIALLGRDDVPEAAAYDALVQAPLLMLGVFAVGAAFGDRAGEGFGERVRTFFMRNPLLWAVLAALLAPDALAPDLLVDASRVLVIIQLPLGFFAVGVALATEAEHGELPFPPPFNARIGSAIAIRLLVAPALLIGLAAPFIDLPEPYALLAAMPCGIGTLIVAHAYGLDLRLTAAAVTWSTALVVFAGLCATAIA
jgi:predicted permease